MNIDIDSVRVENNEAARRFEARIDEYLAVVQYRRAGDTITFIHTEVPEALEGHGIAAKLARTALEYARAHKLAVVPLCPYVASYIRRHPEYQDLVDAKHR
jgi:uncharacterized protein